MTTTIEDPMGGTMEIDWESLAKRLLVANQHGIRIEQESGHRWIYFDWEVDRPFPALRKHPEILEEGETVKEGEAGAFTLLKEYGSFKAALDRIDKMLVDVDELVLLARFSDLNYYDNLGVIFGEGTQ